MYLIIALVGLTALAASFNWNQTRSNDSKNIGWKGDAWGGRVSEEEGEGALISLAALI